MNANRALPGLAKDIYAPRSTSEIENLSWTRERRRECKMFGLEEVPPKLRFDLNGEGMQSCGETAALVEKHLLRLRFFRGCWTPEVTVSSGGGGGLRTGKLARAI
jgi:hypothetical protein